MKKVCTILLYIVAAASIVYFIMKIPNTDWIYLIVGIGFLLTGLALSDIPSTTAEYVKKKIDENNKNKR